METNHCAEHLGECITHMAPILSSMPDGFPLIHAILAILTTAHYAFGA